MQLLIRGGRVVDPAQGVDDRLDLLIQDGKILRLGRDLAAPDAQILNAGGLTADFVSFGIPCSFLCFSFLHTQ